MKKFYFYSQKLNRNCFSFSFFNLLFLFVFASVDGGHDIMAKDNPIELFTLPLGYLLLNQVFQAMLRRF